MSVIDISVAGVRKNLSQAGFKEIHLMPDETVKVPNDLIIRTTFFPVNDAISLTKPSDFYKKENFFDEHKPLIDEVTGFIKLPESFATVRTQANYLLTYTVESGLKDEDIKALISNARVMTIARFGIDEKINFESETNPYSIGAQYQLYLLTYAVFECILSLNNINAIQGDGNFTITYYTDTSKLWGEGHSVMALMDTRQKQLKNIEDTIKMAQFKADSSVRGTPSYKNKNQLSDWLVSIRR